MSHFEIVFTMYFINVCWLEGTRSSLIVLTVAQPWQWRKKCNEKSLLCKNKKQQQKKRSEKTMQACCGLSTSERDESSGSFILTSPRWDVSSFHFLFYFNPIPGFGHFNYRPQWGFWSFSIAEFRQTSI